MRKEFDGMSKASHRERHVYLHKALDELIADWIFHTSSLPSKHTVYELMEWSHRQTVDPSESNR